MKHFKILFFIIIVNFSCAPYKKVPYFQDLSRDSLVTEKINNYSPLTMQPGDLLGINVSSLNHEADLIYNYNLAQQITPDLDRTVQSTIVGYLIDADGSIKLPNVGIVKVSGYTTREISSQLESKLQVFLSKPTVNVRILNFKIAVLGDVKTPGNFNVPNEKITLTEALSLAGDLNSTGIRNNVLLVREIKGNREYITMNLNSKSIFNSPYYYLKNNDVIYVQPNRTKIAVEGGIFQKVGLLFSALSIIAYLVSR